MSFGLKIRAEAFQKLMDMVLGGLDFTPVHLKVME
jgi:hypothetical protein